jgi:arginine/lysine/ornithine decarboxylase
MAELNQDRAPISEALEQFKNKRVVPFDVPGHKRGRGNPGLAELFGQQCVDLDVNSMKPLDNLTHPISVIKDAEELAAKPSERLTPSLWSAEPPRRCRA